MRTDGMLKDDALKGQTIIVTGGGTGLGRAMGKYYLELGANLVITSRKIEVLEKAAQELEQETGGKVLPIQCDVRDYEQVENVLEKTEAHFGQIHGLLNNAAGNFLLCARKEEKILQGTTNFTLALGKKWIAQKQAGTVLNIVTTYAWTGSGYVVPSACAKAGVLAMTRSLAVEWAKYKIRLNAIAPGPFPTEGAWSRLLPGDLVKKFDPSKLVPVGRVGEHQELANLAAYLMSDYSAYVNGEVVTIDGGEWLMGAGEFSHLEKVPQEMWDMLEASRGKKR